MAAKHDVVVADAILRLGGRFVPPSGSIVEVNGNYPRRNVHLIRVTGVSFSRTVQSWPLLIRGPIVRRARRHRNRWVVVGDAHYFNIEDIVRIVSLPESQGNGAGP